MSKIIAINAGSSSLKFQLFEMPSEKVLTKGLVERIGLDNSIFTISVDDEKKSETTDIPDHSVAVKMLLNKLTEFGIIQDLNEIDGIGHRVVHGGEKFSDSVLLTDEMIEEIEEISELAPLHNPPISSESKRLKKFFQMCLQLPCLILLFTNQCLSNHIYTVCLMNTMKSSASANTVFTERLINMSLNAQQSFSAVRLKSFA